MKKNVIAIGDLVKFKRDVVFSYGESDKAIRVKKGDIKEVDRITNTSVEGYWFDDALWWTTQENVELFRKASPTLDELLEDMKESLTEGYYEEVTKSNSSLRFIMFIADNDDLLGVTNSLGEGIAKDLILGHAIGSTEVKPVNINNYEELLNVNVGVQLIEYYLQTELTEKESVLTKYYFFRKVKEMLDLEEEEKANTLSYQLNLLGEDIRTLVKENMYDMADDHLELFKDRYARKSVDSIVFDVSCNHDNSSLYENYEDMLGREVTDDERSILLEAFLISIRSVFN